MALFPPSPQRGQASVELVALLPILAALCGLGWQVAVAGQTVWQAGTAARAAARAHAVGADATAAARAVVPAALRRGLRVRTAGDGRVEVRVAVPIVAPGGGRLGSVTRAAQFAPQGQR